MITIESIKIVDQRIRDRVSNAYEVFERDGSVYVNAPMDAEESESLESPTCVYVNEGGFFADEEELFVDCVDATKNVDRLVEELMRNGEW